MHPVLFASSFAFALAAAAPANLPSDKRALPVQKSWETAPDCTTHRVPSPDGDPDEPWTEKTVCTQSQYQVQHPGGLEDDEMDDLGSFNKRAPQEEQHEHGAQDCVIHRVPNKGGDPDEPYLVVKECHSGAASTQVFNRTDDVDDLAPVDQFGYTDYSPEDK